MDLSASLESMTKPKTVLILPLLLIEAKKTVPAVQQFISCWEGFNKTYRGLRKTADQSAKIRKMFFFSVSDTSSEEKFRVLLKVSLTEKKSFSSFHEAQNSPSHLYQSAKSSKNKSYLITLQ